MSKVITRSQLGEFSSIVCFKSVILGMEDALGEKATAISLIAAGRARGKKLAVDLGLTNTSMSLEQVAEPIRQALGPEGTRLCILEKIVREGDVIKAYTQETVCSANEPEGSPRKCTFTLGVIWGALEQCLGYRLQGTHTESVLRGGPADVFEFTAI